MGGLPIAGPYNRFRVEGYEYNIVGSVLEIPGLGKLPCSQGSVLSREAKQPSGQNAGYLEGLV